MSRSSATQRALPGGDSIGFSVCAKLSYAIDSWQTLVQTIYGLMKLGHCCCHLSEAAQQEHLGKA